MCIRDRNQHALSNMIEAMYHAELEEIGYDILNEKEQVCLNAVSYTHLEIATVDKNGMIYPKKNGSTQIIVESKKAADIYSVTNVTVITRMKEIVPNKWQSYYMGYSQKFRYAVNIPNSLINEINSLICDQRGRVWIGADSKLFAHLIKEGEFIPVSYTHLDVYKRQVYTASNMFFAFCQLAAASIPRAAIL